MKEEIFKAFKDATLHEIFSELVKPQKGKFVDWFDDWMEKYKV